MIWNMPNKNTAIAPAINFRIVIKRMIRTTSMTSKVPITLKREKISSNRRLMLSCNRTVVSKSSCVNVSFATT